jgi:hypothetical protein
MTWEEATVRAATVTKGSFVVHAFIVNASRCKANA